MAVNPNVEVYLVSGDGRIRAQAAPPGELKQDSIDVAPVRRLLAGEPLPLFGDDPRNPGTRKVFSAAPLQAAGQAGGYVYVVLSGQDRDRLAAGLAQRRALRSAAASMALVALLALLAGLAAFHLITRPLRELTAAVRRVRAGGLADLREAGAALGSGRGGGGEIGELRHAFAELAQKLDEQWRQAGAQEQQRRELFANVSHDLRTPLTSLHGYVETLLVKADDLSAADRRRYLEIAFEQSRKVAALAQELFELARLEYGDVQPDLESFAMADLVQDVFQKLELATQARRQRLVADIAPGLPAIQADVGLIERVLTNLLDNAIRHTPEGGEITVHLRRQEQGQGVRVDVSDTGPGIPPALVTQLFVRPLFSSSGGRAGGLGLVIVRRILQLHGSDIVLARSNPQGSVFSFDLASAQAG
jgi:signal transduction histidine kinase